MSPELVAAEARAQTEVVLREKYDDCIRVTSWTEDAVDAVWPEPKFDWTQFSKRQFGYHQMQIAIWCGDRLFLMAVATVAGDNILLRHIEADPDHPIFKGQRIFMVLEALTSYASGLAARRWQIVMKPERQELLNFLLGECGFVERSDGQCQIVLET